MISLTDGRHEYTVKIGEYNLSFECDFNPISKDVIVFIHGLGCSRESFRYVFESPYFPHRSLLLLDLLGFGKSSKPDDFSYTMEDQANLCEQLLRECPFDNIHIVAHSMGNAIALLLSPTFLSHIQSFANIEGNLIREDCGLLSRGIANSPFDDYHAKIFKEQQAEFTGHSQLRFEETTPIAVHKSAQSLVHWSDSGELLTRFTCLTCKKSYFWGEENVQMPILQKLAGIDTYMIHQSGHSMMTENPEEFYTTLATFIDSSEHQAQ